MPPSIPSGPSWPALHRQRRAILVVDIVESVRLIHHFEAGTIARWRAFLSEELDALLARHDGHMVKSLGDGMLLDFAHTPQALRAGFEVLARSVRREAGVPAEQRIRLRLGLHVAEVVADTHDLYGAGVNLAARVAALARPNGIVATQEATDELLAGIDAELEDAGLNYLKHLDEPVHVWHLLPAGAAQAWRTHAADAALPVDISDPEALRPCVALVPLSGDHQVEGLATLSELVGDMLLARLSSLGALRVISRMSSVQFWRRGLAPRDIADLTGARFLISGSLHGSPDRATLLLQLSDSTGGDLLWSDRVHLSAADLLAQDEAVTGPLAQSMAECIVEHRLRSAVLSPMPTLDSQTLQFAAVHLAHRQSLADFARAGQILGHLVERHPRAPDPLAWLAKWHMLRVTKGLAPNLGTEGDRALEFTRRALDIDPHSARALAIEAFVHCHLQRDLAPARTRVREALALNPNEPWAWLIRATVESLSGNGDLAWAAAQQACSLSPLDPLRHYFDGLSASAAVSAERWDDAIALARRALCKDGRHLPTLRALAIAQARSDRMDEARDTVQQVLALAPDFSLSSYVSLAPRGGEGMRSRWAEALRAAGAPD